MFPNLVFLSVSGGFGGKITILKPAGERPSVLMDHTMVSQSVLASKSLTTIIAGDAFKLFISMFCYQVLLQGPLV